MTRTRWEGGRGADPGTGGSEGPDPPASRAVLAATIPATAGIVPFGLLGKDVAISPAVAWLLVVLNVSVVVGAIMLFRGSRRRRGSRSVDAATDPDRASVERVEEPSQPAPTPPPPAEPPTRPSPPRTEPRADPAWTWAAGSRAASPRAPAEIDPKTLTDLGDPDPFVRVKAVAAMRGHVEYETILVRALHDRYPIVRREVVRTLRTTGGPLATEALIEVAAHDPSAEVREEAVASLGALLRERKPESGSG